MPSWHKLDGIHMIDMMAAITGFENPTNTTNPNQQPTFHTVDGSEIPNNHRLDVSNLL